MKSIRFVNPFSNKVFSVNISNDEMDVRNLIASLLNVEPDELLGVKNKFGSFIPFASFIDNDFDEYDIYFILLRLKSSNSLMSSRNRPKIETYDYNNHYPDSNYENENEEDAFDQDYYENDEDNYPYVSYKQDVYPRSFSTNYNLLKLSHENKRNLYQKGNERSENDIGIKRGKLESSTTFNSIYSVHPKKENFITSLYSSKGLSGNSLDEQEQLINLKILVELNDNNLLNENTYKAIKKLIHSNNHSVQSMFSLFQKRILDCSTLIFNLQSLLMAEDKNEKNNSSNSLEVSKNNVNSAIFNSSIGSFKPSYEDSSLQKSNSFSELSEIINHKLYPDYFQNTCDIGFLNGLLNYQEKCIQYAYEIYKMDGDFDSLVETFKILCKRRDLSIPSATSTSQNTSSFSNSKLLQSKFKPENSNLVRITEENYFKNDTLAEEEEANEKFYHEEFDYENLKRDIDQNYNLIEKTMFNYCLNTNKSKIDYLITLKELLKDSELNFKIIKASLMNCFYNEFANFIEDPKNKEIFKEFIKKKEKEKDKEVFSIFQSLEEGNLEGFKESLKYYYNSKFNEIHSPKKSPEDKKWWERTQEIFFYIKKRKFLTQEEQDKLLKSIKEKKERVLDIIREIKLSKDITPSMVVKIKGVLEDLDDFKIKMNELLALEYISKIHYNYFLTRYSLQDANILEAWGIYENNRELESFINRLRNIYYNHIHFENKHKNTTPNDFKRNLGTIINSAQGQHITDKQLRIIDCLAKGGILIERFVPDLKLLVLEKNTLIVSAFEIFSVTLDHWDFCESLELIAEVYHKNGSHFQKEKDQDKMTKIIENYIERNNINGFYREKIWKLLRMKDRSLLSTLDAYLDNRSSLDEFEETLFILLSN